jgi:hypothetical protein
MSQHPVLVRAALVVLIAALSLISPGRAVAGSAMVCATNCGDWIMCPDESERDNMCFQACGTFSVTGCYISGDPACEPGWIAFDCAG